MDNPAEQAAIECMSQVIKVLKEGQSFLLEAGAGAGKTYTLIEALKYLIKKNEVAYTGRNSKIACITYTNVAKDEIRSRTDNHPILFSETIHAFCWHIIQDFQKMIRGIVPDLSDKWRQRCDEVGDISKHQVVYSLGFPKISEKEIFLHHDDVIKLMTFLLAEEKFVLLLKSRFPVIFIDEYQDTNKDLANALVKSLIEIDSGLLIGFFGDHWQTIYGTKSVGLIKASADRLAVIGKNANFRSDRLIVESLNRLRPELPQHEKDPRSAGEIIVFDSENFGGNRRTGSHWKGDLPEDTAHQYLEEVREKLIRFGWEFESEFTKILMLTNNVLATEQGYGTLFSAFSDSDDLLKKNNPYVSYLIDIIEPGCAAYENKKYGEMFNAFKLNSPKIKRFEDKKVWSEALDKLMAAREIGTIGDVLSVIKATRKLRLPEKLAEREAQYDVLKAKIQQDLDESEALTILKHETLYKVPYSELKNVERYIQDKTIFSTKHGVKGAQFDNVLIVLGGGWNHYNWNQMLEWMKNGTPDNKKETFERSRNLFYVACSRSKKRLCLLFTQKLSSDSRDMLSTIFHVDVLSV